MQIVIVVAVCLAAGFIGGVVSARRVISEVKAVEADLKAVIAKLDSKL